MVFGAVSAARADNTPTVQRDELFRQSLKRPQDVALALDYANACIELHDYEGAIGALERVLFYAPDNADVKAELGVLYTQLHSHQMARQYYDAALASPNLAAAARAKISADIADPDQSTGGSRAFGFVQTGVRYQTNAASNSDNNIIRLASIDNTFLHPGERSNDGNGFQLVQLGYDYDLGNQRGDTIEARLTGYATEQFRFTDLDVGFYDVSIGPRFAIAPDTLPGWTVKPYVVGGQLFLAGARYLNSGGAGILADLPVRPGLVIEPGAEVRRLDFNNVSVFSSLNTGETVTLSLAGQAVLNDTLSLAGRVFFSRNFADAAYQTSSSIAEEFSVAAHFASPIRAFPTVWSVAPYVKLLQTNFDAPNPFIDATTNRRDNEVALGVVFDTPISKRVSLMTHVEYARIDSTVPNFRLMNVSVLSGPTFKF